MEEAYLTTINNLEIAIRNTNWWDFKRSDYLQQQLEHFEELLDTYNKTHRL